MQMRPCLVWGVLASAVWLSGCAITLNLPANRFESPETQGDQKFYIEAGSQGSNKVIIVEDTTAVPPQTTSPRLVRSNSSILLGGGFGILPRLDLGVRVNGNAPAMLKAKFQILGEGRVASMPGNFSLAVSGGVGSNSKTRTDSDGFSAVSASSETDFFNFDTSLILGYRVATSMLLYGSIFYSNTSVDGTITQTPSGTSTPFSGTATQEGLNFGVEFAGKSVGVMAEVGAAAAKYGSADSTDAYLGLIFKIYP